MNKLVVVSAAPLILKNEKYFLYSPYEKEMQLWAKHSDAIQFCCPVWTADKSLLIAPVSFPTLNPIVLEDFDTTYASSIIKAIPFVFINTFRIYKAMAQADHIHLRCPGNMSLLGTLVQIAFPKKKKTAKYAGNWDPKSIQPWSYRLQKWIVSNTFLTKNMQALVYGEWPNQTKNIKPFFTATYSQQESKDLEFRSKKPELKDEIKCLFVGTLSKGKQPIYAIQLVEKLSKLGKKVSLDVYGEGILRNEIEAYIKTHELTDIVTLKGNQTKENIKEAYQKSHFLILPSKSEGWPKSVAEAMFWGCVPVVTPVSCVPYMLDAGKRGLLLTEEIQKDTNALEELIGNPTDYQLKSKAAQQWSQHYTTDLFEEELKKLLGV
ncbi:glycosyltransferase family 4 protein [Flavobacterium ardleyense]|uniref:Glycosyltransferase family 4 protein n=1 Tax=Flavobacterium ardleyense TaxID=2038737 RepID=A0ABW5ZAT3_9FLAO